MVLTLPRKEARGRDVNAKRAHIHFIKKWREVNEYIVDNRFGSGGNRI